MRSDSEHSLIHNEYYDKTAEAEAINGSHPGLITLGRAEDLGSQALEAGTNGRCPREYIRSALCGYHQGSFGLEPDALVRGQKGPLDSGAAANMGRQAGGNQGAIGIGRRDMSDENLIDEHNTELTMVAGTVIEADYVYIAQYLDKYRRVWDEVEYSRVSMVDLSDKATPWMAHDLRFKVVSVCVWSHYPGAKRLYVAMSDQGQLELIGPGGNPTLNEVIPGSGLSKPWSDRHGYMNSIRQIGTSLYAGGGARQVYRRTEPGGWQPIHGPILATSWSMAGRRWIGSATSMT